MGTVCCLRYSKSAGGKIYQIIFHDVTEILQLRRKNQQWDLMERSALYTAITSAYPMIIFGNLTRNTCSVLDQEGQSLHSLDWLIEDYVAHARHHLRQLTAGKS